MQQIVWKGCTQWNENPARGWPTSTSCTQASEGKKEQTDYWRTWYLLIKITVRFLSRLPGIGITRQLYAWRLQTWYIESCSSQRVYRSWGECPLYLQIHNKPFSPKNNPAPYFVFQTSLFYFLSMGKIHKRNNWCPYLYDPSYCFVKWFLFSLILGVLGGLGIDEYLVWSAVEFPAISPRVEKYKIQNSIGAEVLLEQVSFCLPPSTRSLSRWYQYCYRYLLLGCAVDIHSPHACKRCLQWEKQEAALLQVT